MDANQSGKTDGERTGEIQRGGMDLLSEINARLSALETGHADLKSQLDAAKEKDFGVDAAHVNHVMLTHFFHDRPAPDDASKKPVG